MPGLGGQAEALGKPDAGAELRPFQAGGFLGFGGSSGQLLPLERVARSWQVEHRMFSRKVVSALRVSRSFQPGERDAGFVFSGLSSSCVCKMELCGLSGWRFLVERMT